MRFQPLILTLCVVSLCYKTAAEEPVIDQAELSKFVNAESPDLRLSLGQKLFQKASDESWKKMLMDESDDVAVAAAWETVLRASDGHFCQQNDSDDCAHSQAEWFVGFLEGRLKVSVPSAWKSYFKGFEVNGASLGGKKMILGGKKTWMNPYKSNSIIVGSTVPMWNELKGVAARQFKDGIHVRIDKDEVIIDKSIEKSVIKEISSTHCMSGCVREDKMFIAFHNDELTINPLVLCFNRKTNDLMWKSRVSIKLSEPYISVTFPVELLVEFLLSATIDCEESEEIDDEDKDEKEVYQSKHPYFQRILWANTDDMVYLFGLSTHSLYIQGFRLNDGKSTFRFNSMPRAVPPRKT
jgi:hypothetical protein